MRDIQVTLGETNNGPMLYLPQDVYVGRSLELYGEFSTGEQDFFKFAAQRGGAAVDIGANMGAHALAMAQKYEQVFAFEPQEVLYKLLKGNLSAFPNAVTYHAATGKEEGLLWLPQLNYAMANNFGGIGRECLSGIEEEERKTIPMTKVQVRVMDKCEALQAVEKITLIKIDVEGMEQEVLEGARQTINKHQPVLYVENDKMQHAKELVDYIYNVLVYKAFWHITWLFNPTNFKGNPNNVYEGVASFNLICLPEDHWMKINDAKPCTPENPFLPEGCVA